MAWDKFSLEKLDKYQIKKNEEIILLKLRIVQTKRDLKSILSKLEEKEKKFQHLVSMKEFVNLKQKTDCLKKNIDDLNAKLSNARNEKNSLRKKLLVSKSRKEKLSQVVNERKRSRTPRPDWNKFSNYIPGGSARWRKLTENLSSIEILNKIINEFKGLNFDSPKFLDKNSIKNPYFKSLMVEQDTDLVIRNLNLTLRDFLIILEDIFESKMKGFENVTLNEFLIIYFTDKYKSKERALEWSINLIHTASLFNFTEQLRLISNVLDGTMSEEIIWYFLRSMHKLCSSFYSNFNNETRNKPLLLDKDKLDILKREPHLIKVDDFKMVLKDHFKNLSDDEIKEFVRYARLDCENYFQRQNDYKIVPEISQFNAIDFRILFLPDDLDRQYGMFINKCISILRSIRKSYVSRLCFFLIKAQIDVNDNKKSVEDSRKKKLNLKRKKKIIFTKKKKIKKKAKKVSAKKFSLNTDEKILELLNNPYLNEELSRIKVSVNTFENAIKRIDPCITNDQVKLYTKWLLRNLDSHSSKEINMKLIVSDLVKTNVIFH
jgi:predicted  nucleic acid-binding Zn-ribbon protein